MRKFEMRKPLTFTILFLLIGISWQIAALDLTLNGSNYAVYSPEALDIHAVNSVISLQTLYPWLESIDYLEVSSGDNRVFWDASRLGDKSWNGVFLLKRNGVWEVHVGPDIFSSPDRIAVRGTALEVSKVTIWSSIDNPDFKSELLSALSLRGVTVDWREVSNPAEVLADTGATSLPQLVLLNQLDYISSSSLLTSSRPVGSKTSQWLANSSRKQENLQNLLPLAVDAYNPEAALTYLLAKDGNLRTGLSQLAGLLEWAARARVSSNLIVSNKPVNTLANAEASSAILLSSTKEVSNFANAYLANAYLKEISPPPGTVNVISLQYAAIPRKLRNTDDMKIAEYLMADTARFARSPGPGVIIPSDKTTLRFFEAYNRIGRLAISGQMDSTVAANLIKQYIDGE